MAPKAFVYSKLGVPLLTLLGVLSCVSSAAAQGRSEIEQLQATTLALIETPVESGVLTREKAGSLLAIAKARVLAQAGDPQPAPAAGAETGSDGKRIVRIPYMPESLKNEMRSQIKQEVLAQARKERWGEPGAYPEWTNRFKLDGDFRLREERVRLSPGNTAPGSDFANADLTRAADIVQSVANRVPNFNTQDNFDRLRLRARLGVTATLSESVSATLRLSTGNTNDRTSTNQTLGQSFNKYTMVLDQTYLTLKPWGDQYTLRGGRLPNPFFVATDLVWADDLGFEGVAASARRDLFANGTGFLSAGYFPLSEDRPGTSRTRSLLGVQTGLDMKLGGAANRLKVGLALYDYHGVGGRKEAFAALNERDYATRNEYPAGLRQRGNTLFNVRAAGDTGNPTYGLASDFRVINLTAALDLVNLLPQPLRVTGDLVKNLKFNRNEIAQRTGLTLTDGVDHGYQVKVQAGPTQMNRRGDWNASLAYRYLGSDAVLDAFTNSDFGLGGTNNKGFILGLNYGVLPGTWLSVRWLSANPIDSFAPGSQPVTKLSVDTLQFELNTRF